MGERAVRLLPPVGARERRQQGAPLVAAVGAVLDAITAPGQGHADAGAARELVLWGRGGEVGFLV